MDAPDSTKLRILLEEAAAGLDDPSFSPAIVAGIQVNEDTKIMLKKEGVLRYKL